MAVKEVPPGEYLEPAPTSPPPPGSTTEAGVTGPPPSGPSTPAPAKPPRTESITPKVKTAMDKLREDTPSWAKDIITPKDSAYYKRVEEDAKQRQQRFNETIKPYIESIYRPYVDVSKATTYKDLPQYKEADAKRANLKTWQELQHWNPEEYEALTKEQQEFKEGPRPKLTSDELRILSKGNEKVSTAEKAKLLSLHTADILVPGVWTRHWDKMSTTEKAVNAGLDALFLVPILGAGVRAGAKAGMKATVEGMVRDFNFNTRLNKILRTSARIDDLRAINSKNAWRKIEDAIRRGEEKEIAEKGRLLESAGRLLEDGGVDGGKALAKRGEFLRLNAGDISKVAKEVKNVPPSSELKRELSKQAEIMQNELDAMRRAETRATGARRETLKTARELTEKQLQDLKKKVAVADKPKIKTILQDWKEVKPGQYPLAKASEKPAITIKGKEVPIRDFATKTRKQIARDYGFAKTDIATALSRLALHKQEVISKLEGLAITRMSPQTKEAVAPKTETAPVTKAAQKTATKTATAAKEAVQTKPAEKTKTLAIPKVIPKQETKVQESTKTKTATKTAVKTKTALKPPHPKPRFDTGLSDKDKRAILKQSRGLVAWRQGEVGKDNDVWHVLKYPYQTEEDYMTLVGRKPSGANIVKGPGSAVKTVVLLYGQPPSRNVQLDMGAMDVKVTTRPTVKFKPDPRQITKGDIQIGGKR